VQGIPANELNALMMRHDNESLPLMAQTVAMGIRPEDLAKVSNFKYYIITTILHAESTDFLRYAQNQGWFHGSVQNGKDVWLCVHCGGTFGEKGNLARHVRIVHDKVINDLARCLPARMAMERMYRSLF
jgi:hypothetical protein